jgi:hypothetical protein
MLRSIASWNIVQSLIDISTLAASEEKRPANGSTGQTEIDGGNAADG